MITHHCAIFYTVTKLMNMYTTSLVRHFRWIIECSFSSIISFRKMFFDQRLRDPSFSLPARVRASVFTSVNVYTHTPNKSFLSFNHKACQFQAYSIGMNEDSPSVEPSSFAMRSFTSHMTACDIPFLQYMCTQ